MEELKVRRTLVQTAAFDGSGRVPEVREAICDTVFIDGAPHLVLEWERGEEVANEHPARTRPLQPQHLHPATPGLDHDYVYQRLQAPLD